MNDDAVRHILATLSSTIHRGFKGTNPYEFTAQNLLLYEPDDFMALDEDMLTGDIPMYDATKDDGTLLLDADGDVRTFTLSSIQIRRLLAVD
jgi:hypothetical protein